MSDNLPPELDALLEEAQSLANGDIDRNHIAALGAGTLTYAFTRNAPRSASVSLLTLIALRLGEIDGRLEDLGDVDPEQRVDAMRRLEKQVDPELRGEDR
jgi:glutamate mutase epsilon subunit